jgi:hypothetical protein
MQLIDSQSIFSVTDLVGFLACEHLTVLELAAAAPLVKRPTARTVEIDLPGAPPGTRTAICALRIRRNA